MLTELLHKKINRDRAETLFEETMQKILERNWMLKREEIKMRIQSAELSEEEALALAKQFIN